MKKLIVLLALVIPSITYADPNLHKRTYSVGCGTTEEITTHLKQQFNEVIFAAGVTNDSVNSLTTIWGNTKTGSFTVLSTHKEMSCIISTGNFLDINLEDLLKGESI